MSDFVQPQRRQPTRLPRPWDSPGKNTGVGCHFLLQCVKVKSESEVAQSYPTLSDPMDCSLPGSSVHGIFQARVLEWVAIAFSGKIPWRREKLPIPVFWPGESRNSGAWWAVVYRVAQSWTGLKRLSSSSRSTAEKHLCLRFRQRFLRCNIKIMKEQNDKSNFIKIKTFCSLKELLRQRQSSQIKGKHLQSIILKTGFTSVILNTSKNTLEKAMAPHSSTLAWKIPWMEEPGRLQSMGSLRVGHN